MNELCSLNLLCKYKTDNIPGAENVELTVCDVTDVDAETAAEDKEFVAFGDEVTEEEAFAETCVDGCDVLE